MPTEIQWTDETCTGAIPYALRERFWSNVELGGAGDCWLWHAGKFTNGYGQFRVGKRKMKAHRVAYILHVGPIPDGLVLRHTCDNPPCCNPNHLVPGTSADNVADRESRGRSSKHLPPVLRGELNPCAKLTAEKAAEIRRLVSQGEKKSSVARRFSVSHSLVRQIMLGTAWRS